MIFTSKFLLISNFSYDDTAFLLDANSVSEKFEPNFRKIKDTLKQNNFHGEEIFLFFRFFEK